MKINKTKSIAIFVAILLSASTAVSISMLPTASAHDPPWTFPSYPFVVPAPDPIGVGQTGAIVMWVDYPMPGSLVTNDYRRHNYTLIITKPNGDVETKHWDVIYDTTGIQYWQYTPDQVGTYILKFNYGGQIFEWGGTYGGDIYLPSSRTVNWTVQEEQVPTPITSYPLPTEYWTHPIEGQNTDWWLISSNWLGSPQIVNRFQPYGSAPNSFHVMWSTPIQQGGIVGGMLGPSEEEPVKGYYMGGSYNVRFSNGLIMNGKLYYQLPYGNSGSGGPYVCQDLRTGKELWRINLTAAGTSAPSFGWLESFDDGNQHGALPNGALVATSTSGGVTTWRVYDPDTGVLTAMNITSVPAGTSVQGPKGSILRYCLINYGTAANPNWYLLQWNTTKLISTPGGIGQSGWYTSTINASLPSRFDFNKSITLMNGASWSMHSDSAYNGYLILTQGNFGGRTDNYYNRNWYGANMTVISTKPESMGQVLWSKHFDAAPGNVTRDLVAIDQKNGIFVFEDKETMVHYGYDLKTGNKIWGPTNPVDQYDYFRSTTRCAYGKLYFGGYGGILYCYDVLDGKLLWTYGNGGEGNSTSSGLITAWGHYPIFIPAIADGKVYLATTEHSPDSPYYKGALVRCVNATDGTEIFTGEGWGTGMDANYDIVADGYYVYFNGYDSKMYCLGKGPSKTSIRIQNNVITEGNSVLIEGSVLDIAAGTLQDEQAARFPNGVPAVSDDSVSDWMSYVYFQKPRPSDVKGVDVTLTVLDPNNNVYEIGTATSDSYGQYSLMWEPPVPGKYTVVARFAGTESYYPSYDEAAFGVTEAAPTPTEQPQMALPPLEMYIMGMGAALIIALAIATVLIIKKRSPPIQIQKNQ
ncbi:MAG: PQQ-binding-like beta-propeller repeat protein [Candidatus Bathyarchaeota archaeon]|nr:PQQ-binding-like beta-propeller repeat protein [Candidatus Bathyarchaeota archaeon]